MQEDLSLRYEVVVRTNVFKSVSFSHAEYPRSCITAEDGMSKQQIVANCTSQHSLQILDFPASWALLCSGPDLWFDEDSARIFHDMKTQTHKQIRVIANQGSFARVEDIADYTVVSTIRTSASPLA